jgi:hypothetical protein
MLIDYIPTKGFDNWDGGIPIPPKPRVFAGVLGI